MSVYKILESGNPILKVSLTGVSEDCNREELKSDLIETMKEYGGIGLSANQVGVMERVFVFYGDFQERTSVVCFNPKVIETSEETTWDKEGCLTWPGLWLKIRRPDHIACSYEDENGDLQQPIMMGLECRIFQHEMDHMEGTNFTKRVSKLKFDMAKKRAAKMKKKAMFSKT